MRTLRLRHLLALLLALLTVIPASQAVASYPSPDPDADPIAPVNVKWISDRMVDLSFDNPRIPFDPTKVRLLVPEGWKEGWESGWRGSWERMPVVFLLHGGGDRYDGWTEKQDGWPTTLEEFTADKDVVIVMPDAADFNDYYNDGKYGAQEWTTWHIGQLIPWIKNELPVRRDRGGWVVSGLSWGGYGTMTYLARFPDLFAAGFAYSGALDLRPIGNANQESRGNEVQNEVYYQGHNPRDLVDNMRDAEEVWFRTGQGAPGGPAPLDNHPAGIAIEAACWYANESFRLAADQEGLDFHYEAYPQGAHNWWHWHDGFQNYAWPVMQKVFSRDVPDVPNDFHYRSIQSRFEIYGWRLSVTRDVVEFLTLDDVNTSGMTITGSGLVEVVTPPNYVPRGTYLIDISGNGMTRTMERMVTADNSGRLRFEVKLGPSHEYQQFTAPQMAQEAADSDYWRRAEVRIERIHHEVITIGSRR